MCLVLFIYIYIYIYTWIIKILDTRGSHLDEALIIGPLPSFVWVQPCHELVRTAASWQSKQ